MAKFTSSLSLLNPTKFVNDHNVNRVLNELQGNIEYILNFLNGNKALLSGIYGNLWDYDKKGRRILRNGGVVDTFKKANAWNALNELIFSNDDEITWDRDAERVVYKGWSSLTDRREKWIEREIWIPEPLRNQCLVFAIKASGSTEQTGWDISNAVCETIGIQILGGSEDVQEFKEVGVWSNHEYFSNESYGEPIRTAIVPFKTSPSTESVKIKILRTVAENYLHIDRVFVGGLCLPYDNETETYEIDPGDLTGIDINEFFDFYNERTKVVSTSVMGHKVAESRELLRGNDLVTWHHFNHMMREVLTYGSVFTTTIGTTGSSGNPDSGNWSDITVLPLEGSLQGTVDCNTTDRVYVISHPILEKQSTPIVTLTIPTSSSSLHVTGVFNIQDDEFSIVLSDVPSISGYELNWTLGNAFSPLDAIQALELPDENAEECPNPQVYPNIFNFETGN